MKGCDPIFDYLPAEQEVDRSMFDRQIDLIGETNSAPVAQKYLKHVAKVNGLENDPPIKLTWTASSIPKSI